MREAASPLPGQTVGADLSARLPGAVRERLRLLEDSQRATLNLLEDFDEEKQNYARMQLATMNLLEDFDAERRKYQDIQKATVNLLEDFDDEKRNYARTQLATMNLLEDFDSERRKYEQIQRATLNLLEDMDAERTRLGQSQLALLNILEDVEDERARADRSRALLESVNRELEAFSYTVSHDLRAPLRAISGFTDAIVEDYTDLLDEEGKKYLAFIRDNAHQMGQLIDDLLSFSRLGRQEMSTVDLDMEELAREVFNEIMGRMPRSNIDLTIHSLPLVRGDRALIKLVLTNLLSNSVKFTRPRRQARIELGYSGAIDGGAFYVKDNGVGFDMKYIGKLFGVFQRLHSESEFEGTGVGLATVYRIVVRHGGRLWAEAEVDKGATFYFSLPTVSSSHA